jgi:hypothetical protein
VLQSCGWPNRANEKPRPIEIDATDPARQLVVLGDPESKRPLCRHAGSACGDDAAAAKAARGEAVPANDLHSILEAARRFQDQLGSSALV